MGNEGMSSRIAHAHAKTCKPVSRRENEWAIMLQTIRNFAPANHTNNQNGLILHEAALTAG
jgi:hypothetical protein